jgi:hypothetical protein
MKETPASGVERPSSGVPSEPQSIEDIVERWWENHFPGSPVAQVTQAWNHAFAAKEELKRRLVDLARGVL